MIVERRMTWMVGAADHRSVDALVWIGAADHQSVDALVWIGAADHRSVDALVWIGVHVCMMMNVDEG